MDKNWLEVLAEQCQLSSQNKVAKQLNVSNAMISQVLKGKYTGDIDRIKQLVEGAFLQYTLQCPVLGCITKNKCLNQQVQPLVASNPQRIQLYRACHGGCVHSKQQKTLEVKWINSNQPNAFNTERTLAQITEQATDAAHHIQLLEQTLAQLARQYNQLLNQGEPHA